MRIAFQSDPQADWKSQKVERHGNVPPSPTLCLTPKGWPILSDAPSCLQRVLRHVFSDVLGQDFVDQRLVANAAAARFLAELIEHTWIDPDRD